MEELYRLNGAYILPSAFKSAPVLIEGSIPKPNLCFKTGLYSSVVSTSVSTSVSKVTIMLTGIFDPETVEPYGAAATKE